jgi:hypothetical protein
MPPDERLPNKIARKLEREWQFLCDAHLPIRPQDSMWRHNRKKNRDDPPQGWKLHVSATILSACGIFRLIAPCLRRHRVLFKAPRSLEELNKLNAGVHYGFSQVGKFVTVYPTSNEAAVALARELDRLTAGQPAPVIPYDEPLRPGSCVYYRYGQFYSDLNFACRKNSVPKIVRPDGKRVPDRREPGAAVPRWLANPFHGSKSSKTQTAITKLETDYAGYAALVQRGRGGVYRALDRTSVPATICIIKEGRRHGETDWLGRDGIHRIQREAKFLKTVSPFVGGVPRFITIFRANGVFYLVMENVTGRTLQAVIAGRERISARQALSYCLDMARILADIHAAGWAWRDCKPGNFLCGKNHRLRAIDFEGACRLGQPDPIWVGTPGYVPPKRNAINVQADDLYALGASFAQLIARKVSPPARFVSFKTKARGQKLPAAILDLTKGLLNPDSKARPAARAVQRSLEQMLHCSNAWNLS